MALFLREEADEAEAGRHQDGCPGRGGRNEETQQHVGSYDTQGDLPGGSAYIIEDKVCQPPGQSCFQHAGRHDEGTSQQKYSIRTVGYQDIF